MFKWPNGISPRHIHFEVQASVTDVETCDVHFYSIEADSENTKVEVDAYEQRYFMSPPGPNGYKRVKNQDVFLFRFGFFDHMKLNVESMIQKTYADRWYDIDLIIDWEEQLVSIYVDLKANRAQPFFVMRATRVEAANALSIYGLSPGGTSKFRNMMVCHNLCDLGEVGKFIILIIWFF